MCPDNLLNRQSGAGLPVALFVITVLALFVVVMAQLQQSSGEAISLQVQSQRAFFAAESGAQVAVREVLEGGACSSVTTPRTFSVSGLSGCRAVLACESVSAELNGSAPLEEIFTLTSTGQCGTGIDRAERVVEVKVR
ncbi:hypothetical protein FMN52_05115 [Marinobacter sp. BW6]|uniref:hypothetical protein n=1 Tax=Marinobacter sp. BW6 TaxID=2592624 RepID=UPI0011DEA6F0|nr:hypothetical protein [Marinobacter sp. BW6]TYC60367.1 hypothetical protein FMN52_05115 [Marinobacter sp. BW6]